ncbi:MAG: energy transducer TonB [Candidatus Eisenbacteria bacterium]|uniref:Energy transducer TonB n=1 Tax=Eiseniibacteriota bacterium TaxID=2212470 RepID=A0A948RUF3_UNCEI|nr:energy transducer TonB [Candidatus Eisenbacteria bacterium]MBU1947130.1 energy transducer TonB [Candidatus Eisenbacteria bacterium]MBU2689894.1 energy transducer TonB [Candidatus Eisenbacteria bacterium]
MNAASFCHGLPFRYDHIYPRRILVGFLTGLGLHAIACFVAPPYVHPVIPIQEPPAGFIIPSEVIIPPPPKPISRPVPPGAGNQGELVPVLDDDPMPPLESLPVPPAPPAEGGYSPDGVFIVISNRPELLHIIPPAYPEIALEMGWAGRVHVEILVGEEGKVKAVRFPYREAPEMIEEAIRSAVLKWIFRPALSGNRPVSVWVPQVIEFGF